MKQVQNLCYLLMMLLPGTDLRKVYRQYGRTRSIRVHHDKGLDGCLFCLNCYRCKGNEDFIRSDVPGLKVISAHIEMLDHFPVDTNRHQTFARVQREIAVTATVVVVVVVIG